MPDPRLRLPLSMLARLQQLSTMALLLAATIWVAVWGWLGHPITGLIGAAFITLGYSLVLGLEFLLMARTNRSDLCQQATAGQMARAWWGEVLSAPRVFCWRQPFRSRSIADHLPPQHLALGRRGVVLIHGFVCNRGLWNPWLRDFRRRGVPFVAVNLEPPFGSIDDYVGAIESAVCELEARTGLAPMAVAHSMGGLALRRWLARPGCLPRLQHAFTIGTPHHGTWLARFALSRNGRQMRRDSRWLDALRQAEDSSSNGRFTCFWSHCDNIVFPASTATLPGADNRHVAAAAHVHMVEHPSIRAHIYARLEQDLPPVSPAPRG